ncbi:hypothetical protein SVAN01_09327 [Stagonosporopsis vannaccii]|nr:hypothetical protein SVAN01_09327 [Stagonosporopsis vannaccii]
MQFNGDTVVSKPPRKYHRKVKTGCKTCRIRRVKCDEKRPQCLKYVSSYTSEEYVLTRSDPSKALATLPDFGNDMHYLEFYYHCVGPKLSGRFDTDFWSRTILQMAHVEPGVRSALIALGHLSQRQNGSLQQARRAAVDPNDAERRPFWVNYNKAIRHLINHMSKPSFSAEVGLVICLLFACIEFLQADANVAFTHIRSGLNIVYEIRQRSKFGSSSASAGFSTQSGVIEQTMVPILTQALASALPYGSSLARDFEFLESCPRYFTATAFTSIVDARSSFFDLRNAAILLARDMAVKLYTSTPFSLSDHQRRADVLDRHSMWQQSLASLEKLCEWSQEDNYALSALKLGYYASSTACSCIMDETQMSFDAHLENFQSLIEHAKHIIHFLGLLSPRAQISPKAAANFTFDTSLIPALFYTAIRCRCPVTRRKAVELLALDLPREGLWDPEQHRKVAERVIEIEEANVDMRGWPIEAVRLCKSSVGTDVDENNGFQANFLYTKDLAWATERTWSERLSLGERYRMPLSPSIRHVTTDPVPQNP